MNILREISVPVLGICLGHQAIAHCTGTKIVKSRNPKHGIVDTICHNGDRLFKGIPSVFKAVRYHSLTVDKQRLSADIEMIAQSQSDGEIMSLMHSKRPFWGVQFHPESVCSEFGFELIVNFLSLAAAWAGVCISDSPV